MVDVGGPEGATKKDEHKDERKAMWTQLKDLIGADVMSKFSVPVFIMVRPPNPSPPPGPPVPAFALAKY